MTPFICEQCCDGDYRYCLGLLKHKTYCDNQHQ